MRGSGHFELLPPGDSLFLSLDRCVVRVDDGVLEEKRDGGGDGGRHARHGSVHAGQTRIQG